MKCTAGDNIAVAKVVIFLGNFVAVKGFGSHQPVGNMANYNGYSQPHDMVANYQNSNLSAIPKTVPFNTSKLILRHNQITLLQAGAFYNLTCLATLDVSHNRLQAMKSGAFSGLVYLKYLDLSFNVLKMNYEYFPQDVFCDIPLLMYLNVSDQVEPLNNFRLSVFNQVINVLPELKSITLTPQVREPFHRSFENITSLQELNFLGGGCGIRQLDESTFFSFRFSNITLLCIRSCIETPITNGAFHYLPNLKSLDLGCNKHLGLRNLFNALKNTASIYLHTLVADYIETGVTQNILDEDILSIPALSTLSRFTLRNSHVRGIYPKALAALKELKYLGIGFNNLWPLEDSSSDDWRIDTYNAFVSMPLTTIDVSYLLTSGHPYNDLYHVHKFTEDFFKTPPDIIVQELRRPRTIQEKWNLIDGQGRFHVPHSLQIVYADHIPIQKEFVVRDIHIIPDNNLLMIDMSYTYVTAFESPFTGFHKLMILDASHSRLRTIGAEAFSDAPSLQRLHLNNCNLGQQEDNFLKSFNGMDCLKILNLSQNKISEVSPHAFTNLSNLEILDLSNNKLGNVVLYFHGCHKLALINLSNNVLKYIPFEFRNHLDNLSTNMTFSLDLSGNYLNCTCDNIETILWLQHTKVTLVGLGHHLCMYQNKTKDIESFQKLCLKKATYVNYANLIATPIISVIVIVVIFSSVLYYRWHIRWRFYLFARRIRLFMRKERIVVREPYKYDAFVAHNHNTEIRWVLSSLLPKVEGDLQHKVCVGYRDFMPGVPILENIADAIDNSLKTILLVTPGFVESEWCDYEMHMALAKGRQHVIVCYIKPVPFENMGKTLRSFMKMTNYIEYSEDEAGQALFWDRLHDVLQENKTTIQRPLDPEEGDILLEERMNEIM